MLFILHLLFAFFGVCIYGCCFFGHWFYCNLRRFLSCLALSIRFYASFLALLFFSFSVLLQVFVGHCSSSFFEWNCYCFKQNYLFFSSVILTHLASRIGEVETSTQFCVLPFCSFSISFYWVNSPAYFLCFYRLMQTLETPIQCNLLWQRGMPPQPPFSILKKLYKSSNLPHSLCCPLRCFWLCCLLSSLTVWLKSCFL